MASCLVNAPSTLREVQESSLRFLQSMPILLWFGRAEAVIGGAKGLLSRQSQPVFEDSGVNTAEAEAGCPGGAGKEAGRGRCQSEESGRPQVPRSLLIRGVKSPRIGGACLGLVVSSQHDNSSLEVTP